MYVRVLCADKSAKLDQRLSSFIPSRVGNVVE
jgi:hypothetical protein